MALIARRASRQELDTAAATLVVYLKSQKEPPERVVLRVKEILGEVGIRASYAGGDPSLPGGDGSLYRDLIAWCIRQYYDGC